MAESTRPGENPVNPLERWMSIGKKSAVVGAGLGFLAGIGIGVTHGPKPTVALSACVLALILGLFLLIFGLIMWFITARQRQEVEDLIQGVNRLAAWSYTPDHWDRYVRAQIWESARVVFYICLITDLILAGITFSVLREPSPDQKVPSATVAAIVAAIALGINLLMMVIVTLPHWFLLGSPTRTSYIGQRGLLLGGKYHSWTGFGATFESAVLRESDPPVLIFSWWQRGAGAYGSSVLMNVAVPVPPESTPEARAVVESFAGRKGA